MKCSEFLRLFKRDGWFIISQKGTHILKCNIQLKDGILIFPNHGSSELGKGLERQLRKEAKL